MNLYIITQNHVRLSSLTESDPYLTQLSQLYFLWINNLSNVSFKIFDAIENNIKIRTWFKWKTNKIFLHQSILHIEKSLQFFAFRVWLGPNDLTVVLSALAQHILFSIYFVHQLTVDFFCNFQNLPNLVQLNQFASLPHFALLHLFLQILQQFLLIFVHFQLFFLNSFGQVAEFQLFFKGVSDVR